MRISKRAINVGLVLGIAVTTGHLMQHGPGYVAWLTGSAAAAPETRAAQSASLPPLTGIVPLAAEAVDAPLPGDPAAAFASERGGAENPVAVVAAEDGAGPGAGPTYGPLGLPCTTELTGSVMPGGMVALHLTAPCRASQAVVVSHGELSATFLTSASGELETVFPAFAWSARYSARFSDGEASEIGLTVPGAEGFERVATMWRGADALAIHAFEYGAAHGEAGHVWHGAPSSATAAEAGRGGFLVRLGSPEVPGARLAEVYSFPAADAAREGAVRIVLEAQVTAQNCGRELRAETLQIGADLPDRPVGVVLAMPGCDAIGDYLQLKNLTRDLKIAAN